jgi:hypothetical protein
MKSIGLLTFDLLAKVVGTGYLKWGRPILRHYWQQDSKQIPIKFESEYAILFSVLTVIIAVMRSSKPSGRC